VVAVFENLGHDARRDVGQRDDVVLITQVCSISAGLRVWSLEGARAGIDTIIAIAHVAPLAGRGYRYCPLEAIPKLHRHLIAGPCLYYTPTGSLPREQERPQKKGD
jgi:hypothetical protein